MTKTDPLVGEISANMMADGRRSGSSAKSLNELLNDRSLERKLQFDENEDESESASEALPDLVALAQQRRAEERQTGLPAAASPKRARQAEARRAAVAQKEAEEEEASSWWSNITFLQNDSGEVTPLSLLEAGTWTGIAILVLWEVYLNSPLFERAAPMAPVVYEFFL